MPEEEDDVAPEEDVDPDAIVADEDDGGNPPLGIKIRLWHMEEEHRGAFLGQVKLGYEVSE